MKTTDPRYAAFLKKVRSARKQAGMTQVEVAASLGKTQAFVWKFEVGERRLDFMEVVQLAKLYGKKITYFVP